MSDTAPTCPQCTLDHCYHEGTQWLCPDCGFEWAESAQPSDSASASRVVRDAHGSVLQAGDSVIVVKDLKVKGSSTVLKKGTKIKGIRLPEDAGDHAVDCKTEQGSFLLKAEFLKKA